MANQARLHAGTPHKAQSTTEDQGVHAIGNTRRSKPTVPSHQEVEARNIFERKVLGYSTLLTGCVSYLSAWGCGIFSIAGDHSNLFLDVLCQLTCFLFGALIGLIGAITYIECTDHTFTKKDLPANV